MMIKRGWSIITALLLAVLLAVPAQAAELPDLDRTGSISVKIKDQNGDPVTDGSLEMICVAEVVSDNGIRYEYTDDFAGCTEKLNDDTIKKNGSEKLAAALKKFADGKGLSGTVVKLGSDGSAKFSDLKLGLYLITQKGSADGYTAVEPFLVSVPLEENGKLVYDVNASPKPNTVTVETTTPPDETETTPPPGEKIPQTGQVWWPVPLFAGVGAVLVLLGVLVRRSKKNG